MAWIYLIAAGILEAGWILGISVSGTLSKPIPILVAGSCMVCSLILFSLATRAIPIHIAYLVWVGIGVLTLSLIQTVIFKGDFSLYQWLCLGLIAIGIGGLKLFP